jgi:probable HAF family extracellular repeat protein
MWNRSAANVVDLHALLATGYSNSVATGIDADGNVVGYAWSNPDNHHAFLWKPQ